MLAIFNNTVFDLRPVRLETHAETRVELPKRAIEKCSARGQQYTTGENAHSTVQLNTLACETGSSTTSKDVP